MILHWRCNKGVVAVRPKHIWGGRRKKLDYIWRYLTYYSKKWGKIWFFNIVISTRIYEINCIINWWEIKQQEIEKWTFWYKSIYLTGRSVGVWFNAALQHIRLAVDHGNILFLSCSVFPLARWLLPFLMLQLLSFPWE